MKKLLALLMAVLMVVSFASCGGSVDEPVASPDVEVASDWDYIQEKGVMVIGVTNYPPMNYMDDNGAWTGFDTEFAQAVGEKLGVAVEFVEISWEAK